MSASNDWVEAQVRELGLAPDDPRYSMAAQAAGQGWPAQRIAKLLGIDREGSDHDDYQPRLGARGG